MKSGYVTLTMTAKEADRFSFALSDVGCWASGFAAGAATAEFSAVDGPLNINVLRDLNVRIKRAQNQAESSEDGVFVRVFDNGGISGAKPGRSSLVHAMRHAPVGDPDRFLIARLVPFCGNEKLLDIIKDQQK